jgi:hypothetical protein
MARIIFSSLVSSITGKIGGGVLQRYKGGTSLRSFSRRKLTSPLTGSAVQARLIIPEVQNAWNELSFEDRSLWVSMVSYLSPHQKNNINALLSAHQLFLKYNSTRLFAGLTILTTPSFDFLRTVPLSPSLSFPYGHLTLQTVLDLDNSTYQALVKLTPPLRSTINFFSNRLKIIQLDNFPRSSFDIHSAYISTFGVSPMVGDVIGIEWVAFHPLSPDIRKPLRQLLTVN